MRRRNNWVRNKKKCVCAFEKESYVDRNGIGRAKNGELLEDSKEQK